MFTDFDAFGFAAVDEYDPAPPAVRPLMPTVFLPGLLCDAALWRPQIDSLAAHVAPMVADLTLDDSIPAMARRVLAVAPPRFALVALSMGGYVALEILRQAPGRVSSVALLDTSARADSAERAAQRRVGMASLERGRFVGITRQLLDRLVHPDKSVGPVADALKAMALRVGGAAFLRQQHAILDRVDMRPVLPGVRVPTLVAVGDGDRITPPHEAEEIARLIPGAHLHTFDACGHLPALEQPGETAALLKWWLARDPG